MSFWDTLFGSSEPTTVTQQTPQIPGFIQQPLESVFGRAGEESQRPYTPYGAPRIAPTSNFENASYTRLGQMFGVPGNSASTRFPVPPNESGSIRGSPRVSNEEWARKFQGNSSVPPSGNFTLGPESIGTPQYQAPLDYATTLAASAGERGLNPGQFTDPGTSNAYMSPYMEDVIRRSQEEATRQSGAQKQELDTQAAQMGAFGGGRHNVLEAERQRNLSTLLSDIGIRGRQSAFENAQQQFERDRQARLSGLSPALSASGQVGNLATTGVNLGMTGVNALNTAGQQQRGTQQSSLDLAYQDFLNQRNYPQKQIQFLSDIIRGNQQPGGSTTTATTTGQNPSLLAQLGGTALGVGQLGVAAGGLRNLWPFVKGGAVKSAFADGGSVVAGGREINSLEGLNNLQLMSIIRRGGPQGKEAQAILAKRIPNIPGMEQRSTFPPFAGNKGIPFTRPSTTTPENTESAFTPSENKWEDLLAGQPRNSQGAVVAPRQVSQTAFGPPMPPSTSTFDRSRDISGGLPSPATPTTPAETPPSFFDKLNNPVFAAAMRMMGAQRGENLFQTLGAAGATAMAHNQAQKEFALKQAASALEKKKVDIEQQKANTDLMESRSRANYYDKQAKSHGTPYALVNDNGKTTLHYSDGFSETVAGLPASAVAAESRIKPALDASKYAEDKLKTDLTPATAQLMKPEDIRKQRLKYQIEYYEAQQIPIPKNLMEKAKEAGIQIDETD